LPNLSFRYTQANRQSLTPDQVRIVHV
jgi:hypothetical protein